MSIPGAANPLLLTTAAAGGYNVERSLRFNSSDSAYLSRTPASAGNRKTWTWAGWVKRGSAGLQGFFGASNPAGSSFTGLHFNSSDQIYFYTSNFTVQFITAQVFRDYSAWYHIVLVLDTPQATDTNRLKLYINGAQITTFSSITYPAFDSNTDLFVNSNTVEHRFGSAGAYVTNGYFSGYLADVHFIDGQALTPSSFTEVSATTGQLIPKQYTGSFGTNGFWLKFSDNSAATATTLGKDYSGNNNNWTPNNFSVTQYKYSGGTIVGATFATSGDGSWSSAFDNSLSTGVFTYATNTSTLTIPTQLPRTWNSTIRVYALVYSGGTLVINGIDCTSAITGGSTPAWYNLNSLLGSSGTLSTVAVSDVGTAYLKLFAIELDGTTLVEGNPAGNDSLVDTPTSYGTDTGAGGEVRGNYATFNPLETLFARATLANGNLEASSVYWGASTIRIPSSGKFYAEFTLLSSSAAQNWAGLGTGTGTYFNYQRGGKIETTGGSTVTTVSSYSVNDVIGIAVDVDASTVAFRKNGSQVYSGTYVAANQLFVVYADGGAWAANFGQRPFAYTAPSGFKALCDTNLPAPVVAKPSTVMDVKLYTGNGSTQTISGLGFSPDLVWIKSRSAAYAQLLYDTVRGAGLLLRSDSTTAESGNSGDLLGSFNSDGFAVNNTYLGSSNPAANDNTQTYVAWTWDAGSSTVTNTQGSITSSVRANASAGFSIVTYTGNGTAGATVGHGLGVQPKFIIIKGRTNADYWLVDHIGMTGQMGQSRLILNGTFASDPGSAGAIWNSTGATSTVFTLGSYAGVNQSTVGFVAYCFAPVAGYSSFGSYTGNGSATDGPFVYTGFRPRWILIKSATETAGWMIYDTARDTYNQSITLLYPNLSLAEQSSSNYAYDIVSNGFKVRNSGQNNTSSQTYIYAAFAENPFQYARAR